MTMNKFNVTNVSINQIKRMIWFFKYLAVDMFLFDVPI